MSTFHTQEKPAAAQDGASQFAPAKNSGAGTTATSILFEAHKEFAVDYPDAGVINTNRDDIPEMLRNYEYPVSRWPVVISAERADVLHRLTVTLPRLLTQIPSLYFNDDQQQIADFYFGGNEMIAEFAMICHEKNIEVGTRLDLTLTSEGFKVLEINIGSSIGGWQVHTFESIIRNLHAPLREGGDNFVSRNTQSIYIQFLVDKILECVSTVEDEINVFVEIGKIDETTINDVSVFFNSLLKKECNKRGLRGHAYIGSAITLKAGSDGDIVHDGKIMHAVLVFNAGGAADKIASLMLRPFMMDKVYYPDHIGLVIQKNKANLAILRELAEQGKFSAEENELVLNHIPWTSLVKDKQVIFKGAAYPLLQLLRDNKDQFVIKDAVGMQGKDVFIGKYIDADEWNNVIDAALRTNAFIVQEFSDSLDILAPGSNNQWVPHKLIWGAFGFGSRYGGVWVRLSSMKTSKGVINSATGAVEAIVFEAKH